MEVICPWCDAYLYRGVVPMHQEGCFVMRAWMKGMNNQGDIYIYPDLPESSITISIVTGIDDPFSGGIPDHTYLIGN